MWLPIDFSYSTLTLGGFRSFYMSLFNPLKSDVYIIIYLTENTVSIKNKIKVMLFNEIMAGYSEEHTQLIKITY